MINAEDIKSKLFRKQLSGYSIAEVDLFLSEVSADVEELNRQNAELLSKIDLLIERLDQYEQQEEQIKAAILNAQRMCDSMVKDAQSRADLLIRDAEIRAKKIVDSADATIENKKHEFESLKAEVSRFRGELIDMYKSHLDVIRELPAFENPEADATLPPPESDEQPEPEQDYAEPPAYETREPEPAPQPETARSTPEPEPERSAPEPEEPAPSYDVIEEEEYEYAGYEPAPVSTGSFTDTVDLDFHEVYDDENADTRELTVEDMRFDAPEPERSAPEPEPEKSRRSRFADMLKFGADYDIDGDDEDDDEDEDDEDEDEAFERRFFRRKK
ncbi:DivIVA domain-containing protein [Feifania hominis]|uniref:DivIVA domain-containing protein n=1 Tax=Feifania hominis TaxID=2763660 RepID=A0A926DGV7_9FIRM|nr:DivIVA domain-containing protein [Feifania hominis]MBC8536820.1 DivIVA domain-containing protein [Feifania hominis]